MDMTMSSAMREQKLVIEKQTNEPSSFGSLVTSEKMLAAAQLF
jgi:hypothetical protein